MNRRQQAAFRRCAHSELLSGRLAEMLDARSTIPFGDMARVRFNAMLGATQCRRDAWIALAGGDAAEARALLVEARWFARTARRLAPAEGADPAWDVAEASA